MATSDGADRGRPLTILLISLLLLNLVAPFLESVGRGRLIYLVVGAVIPFAAVYAVSQSKRELRLALILSIPSALVSVATQAFAATALDWVVLFFPLVFYLYAITIITRRVFTSGRVTTDTLAGAGCVYVLVGVIWWIVYLGVLLVDPNAVAGSGLTGPGGGVGEGDLLYFSYVTLTTLGYGDITPVSDVARSLATVEAVVGVLFGTILVARLVGQYSASATADGRRDESNS